MAKQKKQLKKPVKLPKVRVVAKKKPANEEKTRQIKLTNSSKKKPVDKLGRSLELKYKKIEKKKEKVLENLKSSFGIVTSAIAGVCDNDTFYKWLRQDEEFKNAIEEIQDQFDIIVDDKIKQKIIQNDGSMIRFYASKRMKKYRTTIGLGQAEDLKPFKMMISVKKSKPQPDDE